LVTKYSIGSRLSGISVTHLLVILCLTLALLLLLSSSVYPLSSGSPLPDEIPQHEVKAQKKTIQQKIEETAKIAEGVPYSWGDEDLTGMDCSGFIYWLSQRVGKPLPRSTAKRYWMMLSGDGEHWKESEGGYLVWWTLTPNRPYGHIGVISKYPKFWQSGSSSGVTSRNFFDGSYWDENFVGAKDYF